MKEKTIEQLVAELEPVERFVYPNPDKKMLYVHNPDYKYIILYLNEERHLFHSYLELDMEDENKFCFEFVNYCNEQRNGYEKENLQQFEIDERMRADQKAWCDAYFEVDPENVVAENELF